jgi:hypothetical protein
MQLHHEGLCALAFAFDGLDAAAAPATLVLFDAQGVELRRSVIAPLTPHATGWGFFPFEPLKDSRFANLRWRLELPRDARVVGDASGLSHFAFFAAGAPAASVLGMTVRGAAQGDRDMVFRAWSGGGAKALVARLASRGGLRIAFAALFTLAATLALFTLARRGLGDAK